MKQNKKGVILIGAMLCLLVGCAKEAEIELTDVPSSRESQTDLQEPEKETERASQTQEWQEETAAWHVEIQGKTVGLAKADMVFDGEDIYCSPALLEEVFLAKEGFFPVSYIDTNGLHCVGHRYLPGVEDTHTMEKAYALSDDTLVYFKEECTDEELFDSTGTLLSLEHLLEELRLNYQIDREQNQILVQDVFAEKVLYEILIPHAKSNAVWLTNGKSAAADALYGDDYKNKYTCTKEECPIKVSEGEKLIFDYYFSWLSDVAAILFLDDAGQVVAYQNSGRTFSVTDQEVIVPKKATSMHLSFFANQHYEIKREKVVWVPFNEEAENLQNKTKEMEQTAAATPKNVNAKLEKAYVTFVLDDCRPDMDKVANIFAKYDMPLCIAGVWELMNFPASGGDLTRAEVCQMVVANGGEVLAHDGEVLTAEGLADVAQLEKHFVTDKYILEQYGFEVGGAILAGGEGLVTGGDITDLWSRNFFRYADLYGAEAKGEPYYHRRYWLGQAKDKYETLISSAISQNKWLVFYFHDLKEVDAETLGAILSYIDMQGEKIEVLTYKEMYETVYGIDVQ